MLCGTRDQTQRQYHDYLKKIEDTNRQLEDTMSTDDFAKVTQITETTSAKKFKTESKRLKEKFGKVQGNEVTIESEERECKLKYEIVDLTKDGVDEDIKEYLKLGLDFSETPRKIPWEKVIIETEKMCKTIEDEKFAFHFMYWIY